MKALFILILLNLSVIGICQQTVGLFTNSPSSFNGYTLFAPNVHNTTYLIDNCGYEINSWESDVRPGLSCYLMENGNLLRTGRISSPFTAGGTGGRLEIFDWNGNLVWQYDYSSDLYHQHHDVEPLPNGNILLIAWEVKTQGEVIEAGRNPEFASSIGLWPDHIVELRPIGADSAEITWEWHVWDHLIQDFDSTKKNYGIVSDHPELIDINFLGAGGGGAFGAVDWNHLNGIDYNEKLDQILLSSRTFSEIWIIDHSTTIEEAAGHMGGNSGKGGDLLYRWGNPQSYQRGNASTRKLYGQHDPTWVEEGYPGEGNIIIYNNGQNRPGGSYSSIEEIQVPLDSLNQYYIEENMAYGPFLTTWTYTATPPSSFYSQNISGSERLPNGNTLICEGGSGRFFEVDQNGQLHWDYINPISSQGPTTQGSPIIQNSVFKVRRYAEDFVGFNGKDLTPANRLELNPFDDTCTIYSDSTSPTLHLNNDIIVSAYPNPFTEQLTIELSEKSPLTFRIYSLFGQSIMTGSLYQGKNTIRVENLEKGVYFVRLYNEKTGAQGTLKLIKNE